VFTLFITGTHFSISSAVGFLSLFGVYVLDGVILISQIKQLRQEGAPLREAVERGAELRMRPVPDQAPLTRGDGCHHPSPFFHVVPPIAQ
jgi:Cu/Ag efflux pump CusA